MPIKDRNILKTYFENGDFPDESNFIDLIDSMGSLSGNNVSNGEWIINGGLTAIEIYTPQTINWDSTYTTVNSNSGSWDSDFCDDTVLLRTVSTCPSTDTIEMYANLDLNGHCLTTPCIISDANPVMFSNYTSSNYISPLDGVTDDASAITYSGTTDTLWIVQTDPGSAQTDFHEFTTDGTKLRTVIGSNFIDIEGICWISGNYFAVAEERTAAANTDELETEFDLVRFTITAGQTTVDKNGYDVSLIQLPYYRNHGPEGITYDHARDIYYINRQGIEDTNPGGCWVPGPSAIGVFSIDLNSVDTPISAVELFPAINMLSSVVLASPSVSANFALTDIFYHQELENLFITTDEPDGLIQTDLAGNIIEWSPLSAYGLPQTEGVTFNTDYSNMFLVSEPNYMLTMVKGPSLVTITDGIAASRIVTAPLISATCGTSDDWCSTYTTVNSNSATWESVPPLSDVLAVNNNANNNNIVGINIISATEIHTISAFTHYQDILISELSGFNVTGNIAVTGDVIVDGIVTANNLNIDNWDSTYTTVQSNSASWDSLSGWSLHPAITTVEIADQPIEAVQYIDFSTTTAIVSAITSQEGRMYWSDDDGTLNLGMPGGDVTLQIGQEQIIRVQNDGVANITNGQAVYITGTQGNRPKVAVASNESALLSHAVIGLATEDLDVSGGERIGYVTTFGMVRDIDTSHLPVGETVFLGTSGALISAAPVSPNHEVVIGYCLNSHATNGVVYVEPDLGGALNDLHDAKITLPQNDDVLLYNSVSSIWMNSNESTNWNSTYTTVSATSGDWALKSVYNEFSDINRFYDHVAIGSQASVSNEGHTLHVMGSGGIAFNNRLGTQNIYMASLTGYAAQTYYQEIDPISGHSNKWSMGMGPNGDFSIGGWHSPNLPNGNSYVYLDFDNNYVGIMESVPKTPLDVYGIASADNAVSGRHLVNYQTMDSFVTAATAGIPTDTPNLSSVLAEDNDANNQGIIGLGSLAIGATALSWGSGDITQSTGNWYEIRDPNKDRWMQANSGAGVIFYNQYDAEVLKLGATSEIPSLKVGNGIWTSEGTAISGNQIVNYDTMYTFVTAATAGIPAGGSDVSSLSGNWESTYTTVQANSATWEAGGGGTSAEQSYIDQSGGTSDTYGVLLGSVDGANTTYTVAQSSYDSGTLAIFLNGQVQTQGSSEDWTETSPSVGTFDFVIAPLVDDEITAHYKKIAVVTGASFETDQSGGVSDTYGILAGSVNSSNTTYTVAAAKYASSSLHVYLDGQMQTQGVSSDWVETTPSAGTFDFITAPISGSEIIVTYQPLLAAAGNADTVDGFHASSSATANRLITLDSNADLDLGDNDILNIQNITNNTQDQDFFLQTNAGGSMVSAIQVHGDTGALSFANQSMATVYLSANQTITSGGTQLVNMNTAMFDNLGEFDPVTHLFTVTIAGRYLITSVMGMLSLTDQKAMLNIISINGGNTYIVQTSSAVTGVHAATNTVIVDLDVGDTIGFIILQGDTISQDLIGGTTRTYASILKVG